MIQIAGYFELDENELVWSFVRASGPGGQNVNKVATAVQLCFNVRQSPSVPDSLKARILENLAHRLTKTGGIQVTARRYRTQLQNRRDALERLVRLLEGACAKPRKRKKTYPGAAARQRRLDRKRHQSEKKRMRGSVRPGYE